MKSKILKLCVLSGVLAICLPFFYFHKSTLDAQAFSTPARRQTVAAGNASATTVSATWPQTTVAGNLLIAIVGVRGGTGVTITPPAGWLLATRSNNGTNVATAIYYRENAPAISGAISWTFSSTQNATLTLAEYTGITISSALDVTATSTGNSSGGNTGTTATTSQTYEVAIGAISAVNSATTYSGQTNSFVEVSEANSTGGAAGSRNATVFEEKILSTTGTQTVSATLSATRQWAGAIATFKAAPSQFVQSGYRFYQPQNSTSVGTPLNSLNTAATLSQSSAQFRLRMLMHVQNGATQTNEQSFKLQFAARSGTCDTGFVGETYADVTGSTVIAFHDNATPADGAALSTNANDPTHSSDTVIAQSYEELNPFTNNVASIAVGQDGLWDFSLKDNGAASNSTYCFRIVKSDNSVIQSYSVIPEITTASIADLSVSKIVSNNNPSVGDSITYTLTVNNLGPNNATGVSLVDAVPAGLTYQSDNGSGSYNSSNGLWTIGNLNNGSSSSLTITALVNGGSGGLTIVNSTSSLMLNQSDTNSVNNVGSVSLTVKQITTAPVVNSPIIAGQTQVSGTSTESDGTGIQIFIDNVLSANTSVSSGAWTTTVPDNTFQAGEVVTAKALASGKSLSNVSNQVTVDHRTSPVPGLDSPIVAGDQQISGTSSAVDGTQIQIYVDNVNITSTTVSSGVWQASVSANELQAGESVTAKARIDTNNDGVINGSDNLSSESTAVVVSHKTSPVPSISSPVIAASTSISGQSSGADGTVIKVFVNDIFINQTTVISGNWSLSVSASELQTDEQVKASATVDTNNDGVINGSDITSAYSTSVTVDSLQPTSNVPTVTDPIVAGDTAISGTSLDGNGTLIQVFVNNISVGTTAVSSNAWMLTVNSNELQADENVHATARIDTNNDGFITLSDTPSSASASHTVIHKTSSAPTITAPLVAGDTAISGTSIHPDGTLIKVYVEGSLIGSTTVSSNAWTLSVSTNELQADEEVYAIATIDTNNDGTIDNNDNASAPSNSHTVNHKNSASAPTVSGAMVAGDMVISGTSTDADGSIIRVEIDNVFLAEATVSSGTWSLAISSSELQTGEVIRAYAYIDTNNDGVINTNDQPSISSNTVTVSSKASPIPGVNSPIFTNNSIVSGTLNASNGTRIKVYVDNNVIGQTLLSNNLFSFALSNSLPAGAQVTATATIDTNNDGIVDNDDIEGAPSSFVTVIQSAVSSTSSQISLPSQTFLHIDKESLCTSDRNVALQVGGIDVSEFLLSEKSQLTTEQWQVLPYSGFITDFRVSEGYGLKNIYAWFKSESGNLEGPTSYQLYFADPLSCEQIDQLPEIPMMELEEIIEIPSLKVLFELPENYTIDQAKKLVASENTQCNASEILKAEDSRTVYYCGIDGKKYPFPNASVYFSWYEDFSGVNIYGSEFINSLQTGSYVTYKPKGILVKSMLDPKVYVVAPYEELRWLISEEIAVQYFGEQWNSKVIDMPDELFEVYVTSDQVSN